MRSLRLFFIAWVAIFCLTGCLQVEKVVSLNADGSGTIQETLVLSKASLAQIQKMMAGFGGDKAGAAKDFKLLDEAKLKEAAGKMGEGVTFVSAKPISSEQGEGFVATYAFTDINKLKVNQNPGDNVPSVGGAKASSGKNKKEPVTFRFAKGSPAELVIKMPQPEFKPRKEQPEGAEDMAMMMMQQMLKDMKVTLRLDVVGKIAETNAEYHDDSRITLMEMDMNKVLADPAKFKELAKANPQTLQDAKGLMKGIDGIKVEAAPEVTIKFQ